MSASKHHRLSTHSARIRADICGLSMEANVAHDRMLSNAAQIRANLQQTDFGLTTSADLIASPSG